MGRQSEKPVRFERAVGGDGCELTIVCEPGDSGGPVVCHVEERLPSHDEVESPDRQDVKGSRVQRRKR